MDLHLQPLATTCFVSGEPFAEGARVASFLVRSGPNLEIVRYDVLEPHVADLKVDGQVACRWVHPFKPRKSGENPDKALKLTSEALFVTLADPTTEPTPENTRLVQFLALMLERKKILKPRGKSKDGARNLYEHAKSKQMFEVLAGDLTPEFFIAVQEQLSVLVGTPKAAAKPGAPAAPTGDKPAEVEAASVAATEAAPSGAESEATAESLAPASENQTASESAAAQLEAESKKESPSTQSGGDGTAAA